MSQPLALELLGVPPEAQVPPVERSAVVQQWIQTMLASTTPTGGPRLTIDNVTWLHVDGTVNSAVVAPEQPTATSITSLTKTLDASEFFDLKVEALEDAQIEVEEAGADLRKSYLSEWRERCTKWGKRGHKEMLNTLWTDGFAWVDIARSLGVSVPAIQKWRGSDTKPSPDNFRKIRDFMAAYEMLCSHNSGREIADWFEIPIVSGTPVTPFDIWRTSKPDDFFLFAFGKKTEEETMDAFEPDWREKYLNDGFAFIQGEDGHLSITTKV
jgi:hypothetical protein